MKISFKTWDWLPSWLGGSFTPADVPKDAGDRSAYNVHPLDWPQGEAAVLRLDAAWACVGLLSDCVSTLPLPLYKRVANGERELAVDHPLYPILTRTPNADMTAQTFWQACMTSLLLWGNCYAEIKRRTGGAIVSLEFMDPKRVSHRRLLDGSLEFSYVDRAGRSRKIGERDMFHILGMTLDGIIGLSAIKWGCAVFGGAAAAAAAAGNTFRNGLLPTVAFTTDQVLKASQREEIRADFLNKVGGALNAGKPVLLEAGMTASSVGIDPEDAQLLESRAFSVEQICRWFRVPPFMVGHSEKSTSWGTGLEQQQIGFLTFALRPWLKRIEAAITRSLLAPGERDTFYAEFSIEGLLRADSTARTAFYSSALTNGWMNRNGVRRLENLPGMGPAGEIFTVQSALIPIDQLGQATPAAVGEPVKNALRTWLGLDEEG